MIVYGRAKRLVSLMTFPNRQIPGASTAQGFHVRSWPQGDLSYVAASGILKANSQLSKTQIRHPNSKPRYALPSNSPALYDGIRRDRLDLLAVAVVI
jgi:hypothetical protein